MNNSKSVKQPALQTTLVHLDQSSGFSDKVASMPAAGNHTAVDHSVLFAYERTSDLEQVFQGKAVGHVYSRSSSPTISALESALTRLEHAASACVFATGMAAIQSLCFALLKQGDHIVVSEFLFGNTRSFFQTLAGFGVNVSYVDVTNASLVNDAFCSNTRMVFCETIANPVTQVADIQHIGKHCRERGILFVVDATMTPQPVFKAAKYPIDMLMVSLTKYVGGHGNALGGALIDFETFDFSRYPNIAQAFRTKPAYAQGMVQVRKKGLRDCGGTLSPDAAARIFSGVETLALRVERQCETAFALVKYLQQRPEVDKVFYPGCTEHPQHALATSLFNQGFGAIFSIELAPSYDYRVWLDALKLILVSTHLGDTRTLGLPVASTIFYENGEDQRAAMGITDGLIRFSVGLESANDLIDDLASAFDQLEKN